MRKECMKSEGWRERESGERRERSEMRKGETEETEEGGGGVYKGGGCRLSHLGNSFVCKGDIEPRNALHNGISKNVVRESTHLETRHGV
jgi:hypothetical protein